MDGWKDLPPTLINRIAEYVPHSRLIHISSTCKPWYQALLAQIYHSMPYYIWRQSNYQLYLQKYSQCFKKYDHYLFFDYNPFDLLQEFNWCINIEYIELTDNLLSLCQEKDLADVFPNLLTVSTQEPFDNFSLDSKFKKLKNFYFLEIELFDIRRLIHPSLFNQLQQLYIQQAFYDFNNLEYLISNIPNITHFDLHLSNRFDKVIPHHEIPLLFDMIANWKKLQHLNITLYFKLSKEDPNFKSIDSYPFQFPTNFSINQLKNFSIETYVLPDFSSNQETLNQIDSSPIPENSSTDYSFPSNESLGQDHLSSIYQNLRASLPSINENSSKENLTAMNENLGEGYQYLTKLNLYQGILDEHHRVLPFPNDENIHPNLFLPLFSSPSLHLYKLNLPTMDSNLLEHISHACPNLTQFTMDSPLPIPTFQTLPFLRLRKLSSSKFYPNAILFQELYHFLFPKVTAFFLTNGKYGAASYEIIWSLFPNVTSIYLHIDDEDVQLSSTSFWSQSKHPQCRWSHMVIYSHLFDKATDWIEKNAPFEPPGFTLMIDNIDNIETIMPDRCKQIKEKYPEIDFFYCTSLPNFQTEDIVLI